MKATGIFHRHRRVTDRWWTVALSALVFGFQTVPAQLVSDGGTLLINGTATNLLSHLIVGTNGPNTSLIISNGGAVSNATGIVGRNFGSSNNLVRVTGSGSRWNNSGELVIGTNGTANLLIITNGGLVMSAAGTLGYSLSGSNNQAIVTGPGSFWSNRLSAVVGNFGRAARLIITNGGRVEDSFGAIGFNFFGRDSEVIVTGANSRWTNRGDLWVGNYGAGARLTITNGGRVVNTLGMLGMQMDASNNVVRLDGLGSMWLNSSNIMVGSNSAGNQLLISNGALCTDYSCQIGLSNLSTNNTVTVTGPGSKWVHAADLYLGTFGHGNRFVLTNAGTVESDNGYVGLLGSNNFAVITGPGSVWSNGISLYVGRYGNGNQLLLTNGGRIHSGFANVGGDSGSSNIAIVSGTGSLWTNSMNFVVGPFSGWNRLVITNGGEVVTYFGTIGGGLNGTNNHAVVTGPGSLWNNTTNLHIGQFGSGNELTISNGGTVINGSGFLGQFPGSSNNQVSVVGSNSAWFNGQLFIGSNGWGNRMLIAEGALVANGDAYLGFNSSSSNNAAVVTGPHSFWSNRFSLAVGLSGSGNQLIISNGALVADANGTLGNFSSSRSNQAVVTGPGSVWSNRFNLRIGNFGPANAGNRLVITNGGRVENGADSYVGFANDNNLVTVTGASSLWSNHAGLLVGISGSGNQLMISDGGKVTSSNAFLGSFADGTNNLVNVSGPNSAWLITRDLHLGSNGFGNRLVISNGALVSVGSFVGIGTGIGSTNNLLSITNATLIVTNSGATSTVEIIRGNLLFNGGSITLDGLQMGSTIGTLTFNGGTLSAKTVISKNGAPMVVGNGSNPATLRLEDNGTHYYYSGVTISSNATFSGSGLIGIGTLTVQSGGKLAPGASIGTLLLSNPPVLLGTTLMEISKSGITLTNDLIQLPGMLTYGGSLQVSNAGPDALTPGNRFQLFLASGYAGALSSLVLPPLTPGLLWTNKLGLDGSIEVLLGTLEFTSIHAAGTNVLISGQGGPTNGTYYVMSTTNLSLPLISWSRVATNQFDSNGNFVFTNAITPSVPQRYFRLRLL
jgi:T5SS/PEP-CTERM-associated repeat protein